MKGLFLLLGLCFFVSNTQAQDCNGRTVKFKCLSPCEILVGTGCYVKDVGSRVLKGSGTILSAPFKSRFCFPKAQKWEWKPGHWTPGKLHRLPYRNKTRVIPIRPYYDPKSMHAIVLYEAKF